MATTCSRCCFSTLCSARCSCRRCGHRRLPMARLASVATLPATHSSQSSRSSCCRRGWWATMPSSTCHSPSPDLWTPRGQFLCSWARSSSLEKGSTCCNGWASSSAFARCFLLADLAKKKASQFGTACGFGSSWAQRWWAQSAGFTTNICYESTTRCKCKHGIRSINASSWAPQYSSSNALLPTPLLLYGDGPSHA